MKTTLLITDVTRMSGNRVCVAGYNSQWQCVRPVCAQGLHEDWLYMGGIPVVRPFAEIELDLQERRPTPPHTEDYLCDPAYKRPIRLLGLHHRSVVMARILDTDVASIFGTPVHRDAGCYVSEGSGQRSLGTVLAKTVTTVIYGIDAYNRWDYRVNFSDAHDERYSLRVTDLTFRYYADYLHSSKAMDPDTVSHTLTQHLKSSQVYLRIGLARGWEKFPDRCYLQITGVHTFPDYLAGKCFADYAPEASM